MHYRKHVFFCINQKIEGRQCCATAGSEPLFSYAKQRIAELGLNQVGGIRVSRSGCLGRCKLGPSVVVYPQGTWYRCATQADVDRIIQEDLCGDKLAEGLLMPEVDA